MVVVGLEDPLVKGIYDYFKNDEALKTYLLSVRQRQVPYWKEAKNLQRIHAASSHSDCRL